MMERSIACKEQEVRAILGLRQHQIRRVIHPQPPRWRWNRIAWSDRCIDVRTGRRHDYAQPSIDPYYVICPYGMPGWRLWVKETWAHDDPNCQDVRCGNRDHIWWRANEDPIVAASFAGAARWRPSVQMSRWASRIDLEIIRIQVERLQDISRDDAMAQGVELVNPYAIAPDLPPGMPAAFRDYTDPSNFFTADPVASFRSLWDTINPAHSWASDPWVWVIDFKIPGKHGPADA